MADDLPRVITRRELRQIVPFSLQHIWRLERDGKFPKRIKLGPRRVGWRLVQIEKWIADREAVSSPATENR